MQWLRSLQQRLEQCTTLGKLDSPSLLPTSTSIVILVGGGVRRHQEKVTYRRFQSSNNMVLLSTYRSLPIFTVCYPVCQRYAARRRLQVHTRESVHAYTSINQKYLTFRYIKAAVCCKHFAAYGESAYFIVCFL